MVARVRRSGRFSGGEEWELESVGKRSGCLSSTNSKKAVSPTIGMLLVPDAVRRTNPQNPTDFLSPL